jgi:hypothetical protein
MRGIWGDQAGRSAVASSTGRAIYPLLSLPADGTLRRSPPPRFGVGLPVENWDNGESRVGTNSCALAGWGVKCESDVSKKMFACLPEQ